MILRLAQDQLQETLVQIVIRKIVINLSDLARKSSKKLPFLLNRRIPAYDDK